MESYLKNGNGQYDLTMGIIDLIRGAKRYIKAANFGAYAKFRGWAT
jgi:hypothetical protein